MEAFDACFLCSLFINYGFSVFNTVAKWSLDVGKGTIPQNGKTDIAPNEKANMGL